MEKEAKEILFDELYQLDKEDSSEEDQSNASVILRQSKVTPSSDVLARTRRNRVSHSSPPNQTLLRTVSAPLLQPSALSPPQTNVMERSSFSSTASLHPSEQVITDTPIMAKKSASVTAQKEVSKTFGKRKRGQSLELKPESQQIFKGLAFCKSHTYLAAL